MSLARLRNSHLDESQQLELLQKVINRATHLRRDITLYVFGSFARGKMTAESDLDIAIIIPDTESPKAWLNALFSSGPIIEWPLDCLVFRKSEFDAKKDIRGVCFDIAQEGFEIYPNWNFRIPQSSQENP